MSTMNKKRDVSELSFFEDILLAKEMCKIHSEYAHKVISLAVKYKVDEMSLYKIANKTLTDSETDPEFIECVLPILISEAEEDNHTEE